MTFGSLTSAATATIIRVKRKATEEPLQSLCFNEKKAKVGGGGVAESLGERPLQVFRLLDSVQEDSYQRRKENIHNEIALLASFISQPTQDIAYPNEENGADAVTVEKTEASKDMADLSTTFSVGTNHNNNDNNNNGNQERQLFQLPKKKFKLKIEKTECGNGIAFFDAHKEDEDIVSAFANTDIDDTNTQYIYDLYFPDITTASASANNNNNNSTQSTMNHGNNRDFISESWGEIVEWGSDVEFLYSSSSSDNGGNGNYLNDDIDSNSEGYYGNDYPDEDDYWEDEEYEERDAIGNEDDRSSIDYGVYSDE